LGYAAAQYARPRCTPATLFVFNRFPISFFLGFLFGFSSFRDVRRLDVEIVVNATRTRRCRNVTLCVSTSISTYACLIYVRPYADHIFVYTHVYIYIYITVITVKRERNEWNVARDRARALEHVSFITDIILLSRACWSRVQS